MRRLIGLVLMIAIVVIGAGVASNKDLSIIKTVASNTIEMVSEKACSHQWQLLSEYDIEEGMTDKLLGNSYKMQVYECSKCEVKEVHKIPNIN